MKGLTPREKGLLTGLAKADRCDGKSAHRVATGQERADFDALLEQGRVVIATCPCCPTQTYQVTPAGREALSLWERLRQFFGGA